MKKSFGYIGTMMFMLGALSWVNPMVSHAEPVETTLASDEVRVEEESNQDASEDFVPASVITVPSQEDDTAETGPDLEIQKEKAEAEAAKAAEEQAAAQAQAAASVRSNLVSYALQFVGNPYRAGGNDPHTGADCSGFVKYVMQNAAGVSLNRSSSAQARQGRTISSDQMQPGDLIFYGSGSSVNHVAMYIGNGQIVHASTYKTGIKISNWNYRTPVRIASML